MSQDSAGRPYLYAALIFISVLVLMGLAIRYWRDIPGGKWVLAVGGTVVVVGGLLLLLYFGFLALRLGSAKNRAEYEQYLKSVRQADSGWSPKADAPHEQVKP